MSARNFYARFDADRLRIDTPEVTQGFDDRAVVAVRSEQRGQVVAAIGRSAEALKGQPNITLNRPFAHPRLVLNDFLVASKLMQHAVRELVQTQRWSFFRPIARFVLHPLRSFDRGLTDVEERAFIELGQSCGARIVSIHHGRELESVEVASYDFGVPNNRFQGAPPFARAPLKALGVIEMEPTTGIASITEQVDTIAPAAPPHTLFWCGSEHDVWREGSCCVALPLLPWPPWPHTFSASSGSE